MSRRFSASSLRRFSPLCCSACCGNALRPRADSGACWPEPAPPIAMWAWVKMDPAALRYVALSPYARDMAENMYRALWSCLVCAFVTVAVSLVTKPKPDAELKGLVYGVTEIPSENYVSTLERPWFWAAVVGTGFVVLN